MKRDKMKTIAFFLLAFLSTAAVAGPEKIKFPSDYLKGVLYQTLDRPDSKQYRELYAPAAAVEAVRKGQPIPHGTVLTLVQWSVEQTRTATRSRTRTVDSSRRTSSRTP
jgi:hypothetical protein